MTESESSWTRVLRPGRTIIDHHLRDVFVEVRYEDGRLSLSGVEGPKPSGNCWGGCGQIKLSIDDRAPGWTAAMLDGLVATWERWHLNDMRPGCEHQRAAGWDKRPIDPSKPLDAYGEHVPGRGASWNMLTWVGRDAHPEGLLGVPCEVCGYKYGTAWLREEVPAEALDFLRSLPETDRTPAWV